MCTIKTNKLWIEYTLEKDPMFYTLKVYQQCRISYSTVDIEKLEIGLLLNCDKHVLLKKIEKENITSEIVLSINQWHLRHLILSLSLDRAILFSHLL